MPAPTVRLGGIARKVLSGTLEINDILQARAIAAFTLSDDNGNYVPVPDTPVEILDGDGAVIFRGFVQDGGIEKPAGPATIYRRTPTTCVDLNRIADRRSVPRREWANARENDIVRDLVATYANGDGLDLIFVSPGGGSLLEKFAVERGSLAEALDSLCAVTRKFWRIDQNYYVRYLDSAVLGAIHTITPADGYDVIQTRSDDGYANEVVVVFGEYLDESASQQFTGDGTKTYYQLDSPAAVVRDCIVNGITLTLGVKDVDQNADVWWSAGSNSLQFEVAPLNGHVIVVNYTAIIEAEVTRSDGSEIAARAALEGGSGIHTAVVELSGRVSAADAGLIADQLLAARKQSSWTAELTTQAFRPEVGTVVALAGFPAHAYENGNYLVRRVRTFDPERADNVLHRSIEMVKGRLIQDAVGYWKSIINGGTVPTAIPAGSGSGIPELPAPVTSVTITLQPVGETQYQVRVSFSPGNPAGTTYAHGIRFYNDFAGLDPDSDWIEIGTSPETTATFGPFGKPTTPQWIRWGVQAQNEIGQRSTRAQSGLEPLDDVPVAVDEPPQQPTNSDWQIITPNPLATDYRADVAGVHHVKLSANVLNPMTGADYYELWYYEGASAPSDPSLWKPAGTSLDVGILDGAWVTQPRNAATWVTCLTASRYGFKVFPSSSTPIQPVAIQAWALAKTPTNVSLQPFPQRTLPDGRIERQYRLRATVDLTDQNWDATVWRRRFRSTGYTDPSGPWVIEGGLQRHDILVIDGANPAATIVEIGNVSADDWWVLTADIGWIECQVGNRNHAGDFSWNSTILRWSNEAGKGLQLHYADPATLGPGGKIEDGQLKLLKPSFGNFDLESGSVGWGPIEGTVQFGNYGFSNSKGARCVASAAFAVLPQYAQAVPGAIIRLRVRAYRTGTATGGTQVAFFDSAGAFISFVNGSVTATSWDTVDITSGPAPAGTAAVRIAGFSNPGGSGYVYFDNFEVDLVTPQNAITGTAPAALGMSVTPYTANAQGEEQYDIAVTWTPQAPDAQKTEIEFEQIFVTDSTKPKTLGRIAPTVGKWTSVRFRKPSNANNFDLRCYWVTKDGTRASTPFATLAGVAPAHGTGTIPQAAIEQALIDALVKKAGMDPAQFEVLGELVRVKAIRADLFVGGSAALTESLSLTRSGYTLTVTASGISIIGPQGRIDLTDSGLAFSWSGAVVAGWQPAAQLSPNGYTAGVMRADGGFAKGGQTGITQNIDVGTTRLIVNGGLITGVQVFG